jgi:hypothetical protein
MPLPVLQHSSQTFKTPEDAKPLHCPQTSRTKYLVMKSHIPEEWIPQPHHSENLEE